MFGPGPYELILLLVIIYVPICIGKIASKLGRNGILFGLLSVIPLVNLIILGILAFTNQKGKVE
jgi:hypothetical protein